MRFISGILMCLLLSIPAVADETDHARSAIAWLETVDVGRYTQSWYESAPFFQQKVSRAQWLQLIERVRTPLGKLRKRTLKTANARTELPGAPVGEYWVMEFKADYELKPQAIETVTVRKLPDGWRVVGYFIR